jgi:hypothetical protein
MCSHFFVAQDRQANGCLHTNSFAGCKNMEHEVRNVRVRNRVGVSLLDVQKKHLPNIRFLCSYDPADSIAKPSQHGIYVL